jgi:uncharacterized protein YdaU (DUF1376 family)
MRKRYNDEQSPAFQFYANDWISDTNRLNMSLEEQGIYILLYCHCWRVYKLTFDFNTLAKICNTRPNVMKKAWRNMEHLFIVEDNYIYCLQAEEERDRQTQNRIKKQQAGKKGAEVRWGDVRQD